METERLITLAQIRQKVLERQDTSTSIYIGHLECALRVCKERFRYMRNRQCDVARSIVYSFTPLHHAPSETDLAGVKEILNRDLNDIFVVEGGIQGMIDKLKELVPDPKSEDKNDEVL